MSVLVRAIANPGPERACSTVREAMTERKVHVFGPAYLDRVMRVDRPLIDPILGPPVDQSFEVSERFESEPALVIEDHAGSCLVIDTPDSWPGPWGRMRLNGSIRPPNSPPREVRGLSWADHLGGMGAGFASALRGKLWCCLGHDSDPLSREIAVLLTREEIQHIAIRMPEHEADWTLIISSGPCGDKLPVGFRGCHAALDEGCFAVGAAEPAAARVVAGLPNRVAARTLSVPGETIRVFAPSMRNMLDRTNPISRFAGSIDVLCCNRREWEANSDREEVAWRVSILVITDGPAGSMARFTRPDGESVRIVSPAFARTRPPVDTNRAGESFAAYFVLDLLEAGWNPATGVASEDLVRRAMLRASAAAALILDRAGFSFPDAKDVDAVIRTGRVG